MNKKKIGLAVLALALCIGIVSAALLEYYGRIITTVNVHQSIWLDEKPYYEDVTEEFDIIPPKVILTSHYLQSKAENPITMQFNTSFCPDGEGIDVSYLKSTGYKGTVKTQEIYSAYYPIDVIVEDIGSEIQWTFDFFAYNTTTMEGDGKFAGCVIISLDGETPEFQIHNNDGTCSAFPWGTWLYSPYDKTGGGGWISSEADWNIEVTTLEWANAEGDMYYVDNSEGKLAITIDKTKLDATFGWAIYASQFHFYAPNNGYSVYPEGFDWANIPFVTTTILESITQPFTLIGGERLDFYIRYDFAQDLLPQQYTITTTVEPVS